MWYLVPSRDREGAVTSSGRVRALTVAARNECENG